MKRKRGKLTIQEMNFIRYKQKNSVALSVIIKELGEGNTEDELIRTIKRIEAVSGDPDFNIHLFLVNLLEKVEYSLSSGK